VLIKYSPLYSIRHINTAAHTDMYLFVILNCSNLLWTV